MAHEDKHRDRSDQINPRSPTRFIKYFLAGALALYGIAIAAAGLLSWDIVYFLDAPRISVYWLQYQSIVTSILAFGVAALLVFRRRRVWVTLSVLGTMSLSVLVPGSITGFEKFPQLYLDKIGVTEFYLIPGSPRTGSYLKENTYLAYRVGDGMFVTSGTVINDENKKSPIVTTVGSNRTPENVHALTIAYDRVYWVKGGDDKMYDVAKAMSDRAEKVISETKEYVYSLPIKKAVQDSMSNAQRELDKFNRAQQNAGSVRPH